MSKVKVMTITPSLAKRWLKTNQSNRPPRAGVVQEYFEAMKAGDWKLTGETIKFDKNGNLIDGQHRLMACVQADISFKSYVVRGLEPEAFDFIDEGAPRSLGDRLARRGEKNYSLLSSAIRMLYRIEQMGANIKGKTKFRTPTADAVLQKHPALRQSVSHAKGVEKKINILTPTQFSVLHYLFTKADDMRCSIFWERVGEGIGLKKGTPELTLRNRLLNNMTSQAKLPDMAVMALCIKSWNAMVEGKQLKLLQWQQDREQFPKVSKPSLKLVG